MAGQQPRRLPSNAASLECLTAFGRNPCSAEICRTLCCLIDQSIVGLLLVAPNLLLRVPVPGLSIRLSETSALPDSYNSQQRGLDNKSDQFSTLAYSYSTLCCDCLPINSFNIMEVDGVFLRHASKYSLQFNITTSGQI